MVVLAVVVLAVENYLESIQQAVLQVHLDKVMQVALVQVHPLQDKQAVVVAVLEQLVLLVLNLLEVMVALEVHRVLLVLQ
jgi:hypothetical protein